MLQRADLGEANNQGASQLSSRVVIVHERGHNALHKAAYGGHAQLCDWLQEVALLDPEQPDVRPEAVLSPSSKRLRGQSCSTLARKAGFQESTAGYMHVL